MSVLPATGTAISLGRTNQAYTNVTAGTVAAAMSTTGTKIGITAGTQFNFSAQFGGRTTPYTY